MSGEALISNQSTPLLLTAIDDWVRARAATVPRRQPKQLAQLQFHCGNPPPAADPKTRKRMPKPFQAIVIRKTLAKKKRTMAGAVMGADRKPHSRGAADRSTVGDVHRDLKAKAHVGKSWGRPLHDVSPVIKKTHGMPFACSGKM
jgi:hypothetical protein